MEVKYQMQSIMKHRFSEVPSIEIPRSTFDRSHGVKTTFDAGGLVPIFVDEVLPGDTFKLNMAGFARLSTPKFPIMDNMFMETFFFFVPNRLLWSKWPEFCGEQIVPQTPTDYSIPIIDDINNAANMSIWDYFGIPTKNAANLEINALIPRAYHLIWNEWFRDQNLQALEPVALTDGPDAMATYELLPRGKRHDYFTSCLPFLQKGDAVLMSLGTSADVTFGGTEGAAGNVDVYSTASTAYRHLVTDTNDDYVYVHATQSTEADKLYADLTTAIGPTVNELRQAVQVQRLLERDARAGTRYTEIVRSHFGVQSPDSRLQRPEYLGGGSTAVNITPIQQTDATPGVMGPAMGTAAFNNHGFVKSFTEHGHIIGLVNVRADITYQEGLNKMWSRQTRYDFYWPTLAHLGEQAVLNKEIYVDAADIGSGDIDNVFGYQERYAEMRYKPSQITGKFRSNDAASLDAWHLGIEFGATPTLDDTFIVDAPPVDRAIVTPAEPHFIFDSYVKLHCTRPMPVYSIPGLIDHF